MSVSRIEKYRDVEVTKAYEKVRDIIGPSFDTYSTQIRFVLEGLYYAGVGWGQQDAYNDAALDIKDLYEQIQGLKDDLNSRRE